ncbi:hypothetical protein IPH92_04685 [Candidatus Kaiserbacteria bacterium]|nr:MAG: hypothetical protein IPH92_04685 [Candidatus Kaiserbacteria bacterium]
MDTEETKNTPPETADGEKKQPTPQEVAKAAIAEAERIRSLRERLYARGNTLDGVAHHAVPPRAMVPHSTLPPETEEAKVASQTDADIQSKSVDETVSYTTTMKRRRSFRKIVAFTGILFFIGAVATASFLMFSGNNTISGDNITLTVTGQNTVGAGELLPFQVAVSNQNGVPIQSATLIIEYPAGTQSATGDAELDVERKQLNQIGSGELINVELSARVFGEENEKKDIKVSIEYRIAGSNATFNKDAEPLNINIGTSPVVITFNALKTVSTGQEYVLPLTVQSNANIPLTDVLVKMSYPGGFDFTESDPDTVSGEDVWKIATLKPGEKKVITVKGVITGFDDEVRKFSAKVGVADSSNKMQISSILAQTEIEALVERPFLDTHITVNGKNGDTIVVDKGDAVRVDLKFENTLDTILYDAKISVALEGNALNEFNVRSSEGYYDSTKNTISWDGTDTSVLKEILPGKDGKVTFSIDPSEDVESTPTITLSVTTRGQRIFEDRVPQELVGNTKQLIKIQSAATFLAKALHKSGPFKNEGPIPPEVEKTTEYTLDFTIKSGNNNLKQGEMTAELPQYVKWLDTVTEGDKISYNPNTRMMKWAIGDLAANTEENASVQVSFTPSMSQVDTFPQIIGRQYFTGIDTYTETAIKDSNAPISTVLMNEPSGAPSGGRVIE